MAKGQPRSVLPAMTDISSSFRPHVVAAGLIYSSATFTVRLTDQPFNCEFAFSSEGKSGSRVLYLTVQSAVIADGRTRKVSPVATRLVCRLLDPAAEEYPGLE